MQLGIWYTTAAVRRILVVDTQLHLVDIDSIWTGALEKLIHCTARPSKNKDMEAAAVLTAG